MKLLKPIQFALFILLSFNMYAQSISPQVVSNAGNTVVSAHLKLSWTLGEVAVARLEGSNHSGILSEGFHQPALLLDKNTYSDIDLVNIVPNPVQRILNLSVIADVETYFLVNLQDAQGKVLLKNLNLKGKIELDLSIYAAGVYFLSIHSASGTLIQNHKVIKL